MSAVDRCAKCHLALGLTFAVTTCEGVSSFLCRSCLDHFSSLQSAKGFLERIATREAARRHARAAVVELACLRASAPRQRGPRR